MKHFKYFNFDDVDIIAYCMIDDEDNDCIRFIAVSSLGNIELTPGFESEEDRDVLWNSDFKLSNIAQGIANMVIESFVPVESTNYE
jgi:hypothetical protein